MNSETQQFEDSLRSIRQRALAAFTPRQRAVVVTALENLLTDSEAPSNLEHAARILEVPYDVDTRRRLTQVRMSEVIEVLFPNIGRDSRTFIPPDEIENRITQGDGPGQIEKPLIPRLDLALEVLTEMGLSPSEVIRGQTTPEMMRKEPYQAIIVPELGCTILVCDEAENISFVLYESENPYEYLEKTKQGLMALKGTKIEELRWTKPDIWKKRLKALLIHGPIKPGTSELEVDTAMTDEEYFTNPACLRSDLEAFIKQAQCETVFELRTVDVPAFTPQMHHLDDLK